jgi:hypothetical protein
MASEGVPHGAPPPPGPDRKRPVLVIAVVASVVMLLCCAGVLYGVYRGVGGLVRSARSAVSPSATPGPALPTRPEQTLPAPPLTGPQDAYNVKVGQCLGDDPTNMFPEQKSIVPCNTPGARKVIARYDGVVDESLCKPGQTWYWEDFAGTQRDFIVCTE